jgi:sodium/proline symporter
MPNLVALFIVLFAAIGLLVISARLYRHTHTAEDFLCGRRRVPALACELSAAFSQVPPWLLAIMALLAQQLGLSALWIAMAIWLGVVASSLWLAPRVRQRASSYRYYTLSQLVDADNRTQNKLAIRRTVAAIVIIGLSLSICAQLPWLLSSLGGVLDAPYWLLLICTALLLLFSGLLGALWSAIVIDTILAVLIVVIGLIITLAALIHAIGSDAAIVSESTTHALSQPQWHSNVLLLASSIGAMFLTTSAFAQPASFSRLIASRSDSKRAVWVGLLWALIAIALALSIGWWARASGAALNSFGDLQLLLGHALHPRVVQVICALLLCIGVAAQLSNVIATATYLAHDGIGSRNSSWQSQSLTRYRWALAVSLTFLTAYCLWVTPASSPPSSPAETLWFSWHALTAAFAPLLIVRLSGKPIRPGSTLGSMWAGFLLTGILHALPDAPGDLLERGLPFIVAMGIALSGGEQRRNPDRADRGDRTVHDHLSI